MFGFVITISLQGREKRRQQNVSGFEFVRRSTLLSKKKGFCASELFLRKKLVLKKFRRQIKFDANVLADFSSQCLDSSCDGSLKIRLRRRRRRQHRRRRRFVAEDQQHVATNSSSDDVFFAS